jgi:hypothetical protein
MPAGISLISHAAAPPTPRAYQSAPAPPGITCFANTYPHKPSGGTKQRVAIARGMAMEPDIPLMDDSFAALDALTRRRIRDELLALWEDVWEIYP